MDHEAEVIKQQMLETRSDLSRKLEALEEHVASTVRSTTEAVTETVENVKDTVEHTVEAVSGTVHETVESVKETFDLPHQMEKHPWALMAGATALGFLGGRLLADATEGSSRSSPRVQPARSNGEVRQREVTPEYSRPQPASTSSSSAEPSTWDRLTESLAPALGKLRGLAVGVAAGVVGKMIMGSVPESLRKEVENVVNEVTTSLGGKPLPDFMAEGTTDGRPTEQAHGRW